VRTRISAGRVAARAALLAASAPALAYDVLEDVDASGTGVVVRFACPMRYVAHFPARSGSEVRIDLQPMPGCQLTNVRRETMPVAPGVQTAVTDADFEMNNGVRPTLTIHFARPLEFELRPQPGFEAIEIRFMRRAASSTVVPREEPVPDPSRPAFRPLPPNAQLEKDFEAARAAMLAKDYDAAIRLYTKLLEYPEHAWRARSQEYLGLARERKRQLAHAKSEYEEYLKRYPDNEGAGRVRQRLAALRTLERLGGRGSSFPGDPDASPWNVSSSIAQEYRSDQLQFDTPTLSTTSPTVSALVTDADLQVRRRGEQYDFSSRLNAGYLYTSGPNSLSNSTPTRVNAAWVDLADRVHGWSARFGRQSRNSGGVYGLFDGLYAGWRFTPGVRVNVMAGLPRDTSRAQFDTDRQFVALSADFFGVLKGLDVTTYAIDQQYSGIVDRRAIGTEVRWRGAGKSAVALVDYDVNYRTLNAAVVQGSMQLPARFTLNASLDRRHSPFLTTRNALIGQGATTIDALVAFWGASGVEQLAQDRTASVDMWSLGVMRPWGERLQWTIDVSSSKYSDQPASGGVPAVTATGRDMQYTLQTIASGWWRDGDMHIVGLRHYSSGFADGDGLYWATRMPVWGGLRLGPRLRYDRRTSNADGTQFDVYGGSLNGDWRFKRGSLDFEVGGEWGKQQLLQPGDQKTKRQWYSVGYRVYF
jgi:hypothetical protein